VRDTTRGYWDYRVCAWVEARPDREASAPSAPSPDAGPDGTADDLADALPRQPAPEAAGALPEARRA